MKFAIRADASVKLGAGHIMRCLTLADELTKHGQSCFFICRDLPGNLIFLIKQKKYKVYSLNNTDILSHTGNKIYSGFDDENHGRDQEQDACDTICAIKKIRNIDWLIVDHYHLDEKWHKLLRPFVKNIMIIDDLANRNLDCDLLLDQNLYDDMASRYDDFVPAGSRRLLGPDFVLLRTEFLSEKKKLRRRSNTLKRILVFFGGSDPTNETAKALAAIKLLNYSDLQVDVVVGKTNPHANAVREICKEMQSFTFHCQISNMAELMGKADLSIGAGGSAIWERSYLGLPTITIVTADNQLAVTEMVARMKAHIYVGRSEDVSVKQLSRVLQEIKKDPDSLGNMGSRALELMKGHVENWVKFEFSSSL